MVYIYAVRMSAGAQHEHIALVRWRNPDNGKSGETSVAGMVDWLTNKGGAAYACGQGAHIARVGVVKAQPSYIRTYADGKWSDNLLALPRF
jgi:hypothetical protein